MNNTTWGLQRDITPHLGARLVQEGNRLHYLADRASITGKFSDAECLKLDGKRLVRTVLIFTESSDQLSRATDRVPGLPASPGYVQ